MMLSNKGALQHGATITIIGVSEHLCNYSRAPTVERCGGTDATKAVALVCFDRHYNIISDILSNDDCDGLPQRVCEGWSRVAADRKAHEVHMDLPWTATGCVNGKVVDSVIKYGRSILGNKSVFKSELDKT